MSLSKNHIETLRPNAPAQPRFNPARHWSSVRPPAQPEGLSMTNTISIWLGLLIVAALGADFFLYDWTYTVHLGRKMLELIEYLAFWR